MSSSEGNKMMDGTGFQPSEPRLCANDCGFFGAAATMGLCSKCYRDLRLREEQVASAKSAVEKLVRPQSNTSNKVRSDADPVEVGPSAETAPAEGSSQPTPPPASNRCFSCKKKVGVLGFKCRCGCTFCGVHRYADKHECTFDYKGQGREAIAKANPMVKADKLDRI